MANNALKIALIVSMSLFMGVHSAFAQKTAEPTVPAPTLMQGSTLPTTLTATGWKGLLAVEVKINGAKQSEFFVMSTGMREGAIHPQIAQKYRIEQLGTVLSLFVMGRKQDAPVLPVKSFALNGVKVADISLGALDMAGQLSNRSASIQQAPVGWLGNSFLSLFQVTLDYANQQIYLEDPKAPFPKSPEAIQIPFTFKDGRIWVKVNIAGAKPFQAVLDTGTVGTLIPMEVGKQLSTLGQKTISVKTKTQRGAVIQTPIPSLRVGEVELHKVTGVFVSPDNPADMDTTFATLGVNFLRYFRTTINYAKQKIVLIPVTVEQQEATP
ncbi:MAG: retroviral-like aspartic protease family protein [Armatimonadetes bacterium]|nr:retroviral-like aspartic protease family protein [Armatimonadota bacterium]